jgi:hypothetical protein
VLTRGESISPVRSVSTNVIDDKWTDMLKIHLINEPNAINVVFALAIKYTEVATYLLPEIADR